MSIFGPYLGSYQTDNSNSIANTSGTPIKIQFGWGQVVGSGTASMTDSVTFPVAFSTVLGVNVCYLGFKNSPAASDITGLTSALATGGIGFSIDADNITTSGFTVSMTRSSGTFGSGAFQGYSWIAWGI